MKKIENVIWGIVLVALGVILALNALGITNINFFFDGWWTLFIIIPSLIGIFKKEDRKGAIIGLIIGVLFLLGCQNIIDFDTIYKLLVPIIVVVVGCVLIFKDTFNHKLNDEIKKLNKNMKDAEAHTAIFSGEDVKYEIEEFKGTNLTAIFGGVECDIRNVLLNEDQVINCSAIFGGIDIFVPENVKVKVKSSSIFGGVSDDRKVVPTGDDLKTIYINATTIFGGVDIKN